MPDSQKYLIALGIGIALLIIATLIDQPEPATPAPTTRAALTPEQQLRQQIKGITLCEHGPSAAGEYTLKLTIQHSLVGLRSPQLEIYTHASNTFKSAFPIYPQAATIDIQYDLKTTNAYGEISHTPSIRLALTRSDYARIQWKTFDSQNLPKIATITPLTTQWTP